MINFQQALGKIMNHARPIGKKRVRLDMSPGHILAEPVIAPHDLPPFDQSAMDGYAVRAADIRPAKAAVPVPLALIGTIYAGDQPRRTVTTGSAIKIMTGGCLPRGADAVVMKEYCTEADGNVLIEKAGYPGQHIRRAGGEFPRGRQVLTAGTRVTPPVVGLLATCGCSTVTVYRKPKVVIIITGDELTAPGKKLRRGRTYDANSYSLTSALHDLGIRESKVFYAGDTMRSLRAALVRAIRSADVVIPVGGVSVGERDLVKEVLEKLGVKTVFWRAAIKPGKPNYFGIYHTPSRGKTAGRPKSTTSKKLIFGLPGNSVSALVSYHQLVRPALLKIMGYACTGRSILHATLQVNCRKNDNRLEWVRGRLTTKRGTTLVRPTTGQDSHMIGGLAQANCLIRFPRGKSELRKGEQVAVEPLNWRS